MGISLGGTVRVPGVYERVTQTDEERLNDRLILVRSAIAAQLTHDVSQLSACRKKPS